MVTYKEYEPLPELRNLIRCYYLYENTDDPCTVSPELVTPDGTFEINFRLDSCSRGMNIYIMALFSKSIIHNPAVMGRILGVSFQPWAIHSLLKINAGSLLDRKVDAVLLFGQSIKLLYNRILYESSLEKAISLIEEYFDRIHYEIDFIVEDISEKIIESKGGLKMVSFYSSGSISGRRIEQRFQKAVGITPKYFARLMKYRSALTQMKNYTENINLTDVAYKCGYYDQSHFIREFKAFAGINPTQYLSSNHTIDDLNLNTFKS